jgi:hypothetical protein
MVNFKVGLQAVQYCFGSKDAHEIARANAFSYCIL